MVLILKNLNLINIKKRIIEEKYLISRNTFVFLYLGRINKDKGIKDLLIMTSKKLVGAMIQC